MFMRVCCFQKNMVFWGCEKIFFPYTQKGSFFCNGERGFLTTDGWIRVRQANDGARVVVVPAKCAQGKTGAHFLIAFPALFA
ncbi:MAG: hypothetical protein JWQ04_530 [Pedosphaera sp.]|nr:hypothetical protein [Pedosphaera sp.]